jgi:hypothetical protein
LSPGKIVAIVPIDKGESTSLRAMMARSRSYQSHVQTFIKSRLPASFTVSRDHTSVAHSIETKARVRAAAENMVVSESIRRKDLRFAPNNSLNVHT